MRDFTKNLESLGDILCKYPPGTLVLRAQYVYMLQDQFRDLELDYRKISEMYVAEMEKAAKLEQQVRHEKRKRCLANAEACMHKRWRPEEEGFDYARSTRHMNKWLELAEHFKESK